MYVIKTIGYNSGNISQTIVTGVREVDQECDNNGLTLEVRLLTKKGQIVISNIHNGTNDITFKEIEIFNELTDNAIGLPIVLGENNGKDKSV